MTLRRLITSCNDFIWWMDPYFQNNLFELFYDVFQDPVKIRQIRLLATREQAQAPEKGKPQLSQEKAITLQQKLQEKGVHLELRLLPKKEMPHDRYFYSQGVSLNMPPFGGAYGDHKQISEYTLSKTAPSFFEKFWDQATPV
jgi:hypothetical protein